MMEIATIIMSDIPLLCFLSKSSTETCTVASVQLGSAHVALYTAQKCLASDHKSQSWTTQELSGVSVTLFVLLLRFNDCLR